MYLDNEQKQHKGYAVPRKTDVKSKQLQLNVKTVFKVAVPLRSTEIGRVM